MDFLYSVGSDVLINSFTVNLKTNTSIAVVNELQKITFNELSGKRIHIYRMQYFFYLPVISI